jgi:Ca2+-binding RTX toxin-like protein
MALKRLARDFIALGATNGEQVDSIEVLANGNLAVATHRFVGAAKAVVYDIRTYDSAFQLVGGRQQLNATGFADFTAPLNSTIKVLADGSYWALWNAPSSSGASFNVQGQRFGSDGAAIGGVKALNWLKSSSSAVSSGLEVINDPASAFAFAYAKTEVGQTTKSIVVSYFKSDFTASIAPVFIKGGLGSDAKVVGTGFDGDGNIHVAWMAFDAGLGKDVLSVAGLSATGQVTVAAKTVIQGDIRDAEIDSFTDGGFVVTWRQADASRPNGIKIVAKVYDADGVRTGTAQQITVEEVVYGKDFETVALSGGRFAVLWVTDDHINPKKTVIFLQMYDKLGRTSSDEITIDDVVAKAAGGIGLKAENVGGNIAISWTGLDAGVPTKHTTVFDPDIFVATSKDDWWHGFDTSEVISGLDGNDILYGEGGNDTLIGGVGDDDLSGGAGADRLVGGKGYDRASYSRSSGVTATLDGSRLATGEAIGDSYSSIESLVGSDTGRDILGGNQAGNDLFGLGGDDRLYGNGGDDFLAGGKGADSLNGGDGEDRVSYYDGGKVKVSLIDPSINTGEAKGDRYSSIENLTGSGLGSDDLTGNNRANSIKAHGGNDKINGLDGDDILWGGTGTDALFGGRGADELIGGTGADTLDGGSGRDLVNYFDSKGGATVSLSKAFTNAGSAKGDTLISIERLSGSDTGNDKLGGNGGRNDLYGHGGDDTISGAGGDDYFIGGAGNDSLDGGSGLDMASYYYSTAVTVALDHSLAFTAEAKGDTLISIENLEGSLSYGDTLVGDGKNNYLVGLGGGDKLFGRGGTDGLFGGLGHDRLNGGGGVDYYVYYEAKEGGDTVVLFEQGEYFSFFSGMTGLEGWGGSLAQDFMFQSGRNHTAKTFDVRFMFDTRDDTLWYDADGLGGQAAVMMADLLNDVILTASDIYIF